MCKIMGVSSSGYYRYLHSRRDREEQLRLRIADVQQRCSFVYGYRRVGLALRREGSAVNHKAVLRVMRKYRLLSHIRRRFAYARSKYSLCRYDNIYKQNFFASAPNKKWTTDISYVLTPEGTLFLSVVKDVYDGFVVGYKYSVTQDLRLVLDTVKNAARNCPGSNAVLHSDQGFQYTTKSYFNLLKSLGLRPSMSRKATPLDNAPAESFFSAFKAECIYLRRPKTLAEAARLADDYIDFYNYRRLRLRDGCTPYEKRTLAMGG